MTAEIDEAGYGFPPETIAKIEAELPNFDVETVIDRMDTIFGKGWGYEWEGPDLIEVPLRVTPVVKGPRTGGRVTKTAKVMMISHWQCRCTVSIHNDDGVYGRDYTMLLENTPGSFEVIRDLTLIYALHKGFGLGKKGSNAVPLAAEYAPEIEEPPPPVNTVAMAMAELKELRVQLGIKKNMELDIYVERYSAGELKTYKDIGMQNVRAFVDFLKEYIATHGTRKPTAE